MKADKIDDATLHDLVEAFYARVRADPQLGPIFNDAVTDWPEHIARLTDFWSSVMLSSGKYKGQPVPAHMEHRERISPELFAHWLTLWTQTTEAMFVPALAAAFQEKAQRIAQSLQLALFFSLGERRQPMADPARGTAS